MAIDISRKEFEQKFGMSATTIQPKKAGFIDRTKSQFTSGVNQVKQGFTDASNLKNPISAGLKIGSGVINAAFSPVAAAVEPAIAPTFNKVTDAISNNPKVQKFADSKAGQVTSRVAEDVANFANIAGTVGGSRVLTKAPSVIKNTATRTGQAVDNFTQPIKNTARDLIPTKDSLVNENVVKSLDLTAGDASTFFQKFNKDVGRFVADNNLIRANKDLTKTAIDDFYQQNYKTVRSEIDKVATDYKPSQLPGYTEALKGLKAQVQDVPGLQGKSVEIDNLLGKKSGIKLSDVQRVKELVDDAYKIYKRSGDVKDGAIAEGLDNIRSQIKGFIEKEVKNTTGADIAEFNKNVAQSREILDMVEVRSPRGLTRSNLGIGDLGAFGLGTTMAIPLLGPLAPLGGIAAIFVKKALQSPAVMLRIAKYLDGLSDAQKANIKAKLESGVLPEEFQQFVKPPKNGKGYGPGAMLRGELEHQKRGLVSIKNLVTHEDAPDLSRIEMYKNNIEAKQPVEPIKIIKEGNKFGVEDGKHRLAAYKEMGFTQIPAEIVKRKVKVNNYQKASYTKGKDGRFTGSKR